MTDASYAVRLTGMASRLTVWGHRLWRGIVMGGISIWHWVIVLFAVLTTIIPVTRALRRVGLSPWWAILSVIPIVGWFGMWAFAYAPWPKVDAAASAKGPGG